MSKNKEKISTEVLAEWLANSFKDELQRLTISSADDLHERANASPVGKCRFVIKATLDVTGKTPMCEFDTNVICVYPPKRDKSSIAAEDPDQMQISGTTPAELGESPAPARPAKKGRRKRGVPVE